MRFFDFNENMLELLYSSTESKIFVKTKCGDIINCELNWHQGRHNNYTFNSVYFDQIVQMDDIAEVDLTGIKAFFIDCNSQVQHLSMFDSKYQIMGNSVEVLDSEGFVAETYTLYDTYDELDAACNLSTEQTMEFFCRSQSRKMKPLSPDLAKLLSENIQELF